VNDTFIEFFFSLTEVYDKHNCQSQDIYKVGETAVKTAIKTTRMDAKEG